VKRAPDLAESRRELLDATGERVRPVPLVLDPLGRVIVSFAAVRGYREVSASPRRPSIKSHAV
jgi:hypothetical protein